jgi:hypothetical protein
MKPQTALILLPWHLVDWLKHDRKTLAKWVVCTALLWGVPLLWRPDWIYTWLTLRSGDANWVYSASVTTGIFSILRLSGEPLTAPYSPQVLTLLAILGTIAVVVYVAGQFHPSKEVGKATAMLGSPLGLLYTQMALMGTAPAWLLVPLSWITVIIALTTQNFVVCMLMPLAVLGWQFYKRRKQGRGLASKPSEIIEPSSL